MAEIWLSRKLAVLLHADVVASTTLVQLDETLAHRRIQNAFREFASDIDRFGGRTRELRGDALVAEFDRASDAVACALAFQHANKARNAALDDDIRPRLRVGISMGEVVIADGTVTGAGVVLAQRLEQLAEQDGVVVQGAVVETIPGRLPFDFESCGEHDLKGFEQPVRASIARLRVGASPLLPEAAPGQITAPREGQRSGDKPSIAVLPFANMSNDPEQEYFADGMVEDIITALSHIKQWRVVARNSSFVYKGQNVDIREAAQNLGVRYVLEGSVRKGGSRVRITGQLIDAERGTHLWADRFDGELDDVFELQDRITESVVGAIEPSLRVAEIERTRHKPTADMDAYDLYLRALPLLQSMRPEQNRQALDYLHRAVALDPDYGLALAHLAWAYEERLTRAWGDYGDDDTGRAIDMARRALNADRDDAMVLVLGGFVLIMIARDYDQGLQAVNRAVELNPNIAFVSFLSGACLTVSGNPETGIPLIEAAIRVSPGDPNAFFFYACLSLAHLCCQRFEQARESATRSIGIYDGWDTTWRILASAQAHLGQLDEARNALKRLLELAPDLTVSGLRERWPLRDRAVLEMILEGLDRAGLPA